jgi:aldehyde dehydrogenase family 7 member A1
MLWMTIGKRAITMERPPSLSQIYNHFGWRMGEIIPGLYYDGAWRTGTEILTSLNPSTGAILGKIAGGGAVEMAQAIQSLKGAQRGWQSIPAPKRGLVVAGIGDALVQHKSYLGALISYEMGKVLSEGLGEVQEYIDMCQYAVGLSRTLAGQVLPSERRGHWLLEQWHPLGTVGVISAFNFPLAVYGWNAALALVTGNAVIWKPAPSTSLIARALMQIQLSVLESCQVPPILALVSGATEAGASLVRHDAIDLVSFTGSSAVGRDVGTAVARRFGRSLLECGGNNAAIVMPDADLDAALQAVRFAALGTAGQRCTTLRRLFLHADIAPAFIQKLCDAYRATPIGHALHPGASVGPVHHAAATALFKETLDRVRAEGGSVLCGSAVPPKNILVGDTVESVEGGFYVEPALTLNLPLESSLWRQEAFVPILHIATFTSFEEAIALNNSVPQGLSSALFTSSLAHTLQWLSSAGSDCGIVNVNIATSGAEIGGAFGGNKETGGGREAGSDSWKAYMRRATCTINAAPKGTPLELAQGVVFQ